MARFKEIKMKINKNKNLVNKSFKISNIPLNSLKGYLMGMECIRTLQNRGFKAYFVGGCVRDLSLGIVPHDWDIVTSCDYEMLTEVFPYPSHGAITEKFLVHAFDWDGEEIEIAEFRRDDGESRSSESLAGNMDTDSARRDFTFNAIYWDPVEDQIIDPVNGFNDLINKEMKTVKDPDFTFSQDPIRVVRGLGFKRKYRLIDCVGLDSYKYLLDGINSNRLHQECMKRGVDEEILGQYKPVFKDKQKRKKKK